MSNLLSHFTDKLSNNRQVCICREAYFNIAIYPDCNHIATLFRKKTCFLKDNILKRYFLIM